MSVTESNWNFCIFAKDIEKELYQNFEKTINNSRETVAKLLEAGFKTNRLVHDGITIFNNDNEMEVLVEKNKQLRHDINIKIGEVESQQYKYETFKKDQKLLSQEIKETHEAFLMAKKFYKKYLKIYYTIEARDGTKQKIFVQFFTESRKEPESYSVRLQRDTKSGCYELLYTTPNLNLLKEYQRRLKQTNDVPELLCCIKQAFDLIKLSKSK
ncbi:unnamed protein product [Diatraea saccharalis]|uniref:Kinetochore protein SPC25 n=1 Tax=Diatraea saccharalis TaxID=40085 RepID=A0A9N9QYV9_9NEOP|nr:unnamed protein product [Diatraea saccharalis]